MNPFKAQQRQTPSSMIQSRKLDAFILDALCFICSCERTAICKTSICHLVVYGDIEIINVISDLETVCLEQEWRMSSLNHEDFFHFDGRTSMHSTIQQFPSIVP